jgi:hypothetical protein
MRQLDAANGDPDEILAKTVDSASDQGGLADANEAGNSYDTVGCRKGFLDAGNRGGGLRANEYVVTLCQGTKRPFLKAKMRLKHSGPVRRYRALTSNRSPASSLGPDSPDFMELGHKKGKNFAFFDHLRESEQMGAKSVETAQNSDPE